MYDLFYTRSNRSRTNIIKCNGYDENFINLNKNNKWPTLKLLALMLVAAALSLCLFLFLVPGIAKCISISHPLIYSCICNLFPSLCLAIKRFKFWTDGILHFGNFGAIPITFLLNPNILLSSHLLQSAWQLSFFAAFCCHRSDVSLFTFQQTKWENILAPTAQQPVLNQCDRSHRSKFIVTGQNIQPAMMLSNTVWTFLNKVDRCRMLFSFSLQLQPSFLWFTRFIFLSPRCRGIVKPVIFVLTMAAPLSGSTIPALYQSHNRGQQHESFKELF